MSPKKWHAQIFEVPHTMTTPRQINIERASWTFNYGEHEYNPPSGPVTPEVFCAYLGYLSQRRWHLNHVISQEVTETSTPLSSSLRSYVYHWDEHREIADIADLKTFIIQNFSRMIIDHPVLTLERLTEIPISKLAVVLSWGSWSIVSASFNEFNEFNVNTQIEVILERRTFAV